MRRRSPEDHQAKQADHLAKTAQRRFLDSSAPAAQFYRRRAVHGEDPWMIGLVVP